jgi:hypothetical protein
VSDQRSDRSDRGERLGVDELVAPMAGRAVDLQSDQFRVDRGRVLARMAAASRSERRPRRSLVAWSAAAVVGLAFGGWFWRQHRAAVPSLDVTIVAGSVSRDSLTDELQTGLASEARVRGADGMVVEVRGSSRVALRDLRSTASRLKLLGGSIRCSVPRRTAAHAFEVVTPDATIVDLGTIFTVSIEGPRNATRVTVEEGEVLVQGASGATRLAAPGSWSSADEAAPPAAPAATLRPSPSPAAMRPLSPSAVSRRARHPEATEARPPGTLEQEAQLLRSGLAAERQGHATAAVAAFSRLLQQYPASPLAPDARAALTRVEAGTRP